MNDLNDLNDLNGLNDLLQLLNQLEQRSIQLWSEGGRLRFRAPEGALSDELRTAVRAFKEEILTFLDHGGATPPGEATPPLEPRPEDGELLLSFAQERLWFLDQFDDGAAAQYNEPSVSDFEGHLEAAALAQAFRAVVARHEALRSRFPNRDGVPILVVDPSLEIPLPAVDLSGLPTACRQREADRLSAEEALRPFDLSTGPLLRLTLLHLGPEHHRLLLTLHHITSDAWSSTILLREVTELYGAFLEGRPNPLSPLALQYPDFALWQRRFLRGEVLEQRLGWWRQRLENLPNAPLDLPFDRPRPPRPSQAAGVTVWNPSTALGQALGQLAQDSGASTYMVLLAAFGALLGRYSDRLDPTVGSPIANRSRPELEDLIGFFVNTLVLRLDLAGDPTFEELLRRTRTTTLDAFEHQDLPFEKLVEDLGVERSASYSPLFQVVFGFDNTPHAPRPLLGLRRTPAALPTVLAKFDLTFLVTAHGDHLSGRLEARRDLFDGATAARLLGHLEVLLAAAKEHPQSLVGNLPLLTVGEQHQLLLAWNDRPTDYDRQTSLHHLVAHNGRARPDAVVLVGAQDDQRSWSQLLADSQQLSSALRQHGLQPGSRVAVCFERRPRRVVALLAVLIAGGSYVPLSPQDPPQRLASIVADATPQMILTERCLASALPPLETPTLWFEDLRTHPIAPPLGDDPSAGDWPAYVTYTSGSTGRPKGVVVPHRAVVRLIHGARWLELSPVETLLHLSPLAFDVSVFEIWGALLTGGRLVLMSPGRSSLEELGAVIRRQRISTLWLTAGLFHAMVDERLEDLTAVGQILAGGEALSVSHVEAARKALPGRLINGYGPTENTTFSTCYSVPAGAHFATSVPIGRPIEGSQTHVLDRFLHPLPIGVAGDLWVAGDGLAQAYVDRPALTAECFVPDPFRRAGGGPAGGRLYRTGDRARLLPRGELEFLGRRDHQVKLRGYRIEPGEIETALAEQPGVREAVVLMRRDGGGEAQLVAYLTTDEPAPETPRLRQALAQRLPSYMVPSAWVVLDELPRTAHHKIDRKRLPAPDGNLAETTSEPPRSPAEEVIAGLFGDLLKVPVVSRQANFFDLGGQSLLAIRLVSRLRTAFERELPVRAVFEAPTVEALARLLTGEGTVDRMLEGPSRTSLPILPSADSAEPALSFAQERLWFLDLLEGGAGPTYNVPAALRLTGPLHLSALRAALGEIERRHLTLRSRFLRVAGQPRLKFALPRCPDLPLIDLSALPSRVRETEETRQLEFHALSPFVLSRGPLMRCLLLRCGAEQIQEQHVLLLAFHHIVCDAASFEIFSHELTILYNAATGDANAHPTYGASLADLPIQYHDFAHWQRQWLAADGGRAQRALEVWKERLTGVPPLHLPTDRPRPAFQSSRGGLLAFTLPGNLTAALQKLGKTQGSTVFMTLLAGWGALLARTSGQLDFAIGSPWTQRRHRETEPLIGFFVETVVLRLHFGGRPTGRQLLAQARRRALEGYELADVPFERLVAELEPQRDPSRSPLFQAMLSWQGAASPLPALSGLTVEMLEVAGAVAKFDLTLAIGESPEGLRGFLEYNRDLFDLTTIEHHLTHLRHLLTGLAAHPEAPFDAFPLFGEAERAQLQRWETGPPRELPTIPLLHHLFEQQVAQTPQAPALDFTGQTLTYRELDRQANHLAHHLHEECGVGPETVVGFLAERGPALLVGLLGILKAGGVYLPLDPETPEQRLAFQLRDSQAVLVLLTDELLAQSLPANETWPTISLSGVGPALGEASHGPRGRVYGDNLAYVLYTSGSTGHPKAVAVSHRALTNHMAWQQEVLPADRNSRVLQKTPLVFDVSLCEIFGALLAGGCLVITPSAEERDIVRLAERLRTTGVNTLHLPPALLQALLEVDAFSGVDLRHITCGGEAVPSAVAERFVEQTGIPFLNCYGPTESAIDATSHTVLPFPSRACTTTPKTTFVPLGRPINNMVARIHDRHGQLLPVGIPGELVLAGASLARGYLGRPARTASSFVPALHHGDPTPLADSMSLAPGERLYRTGDLVRRLADGNLEFLGRIDHQVKIRGVRVELGEVEAALRRHPQVTDAVAAVRLLRSGVQLLAAFTPRGSLATEELRHHLAGRLPESMLPTLLFPLDPLPRTVNGKMDREAVVEAASTFLDTSPPSALPTGGTERALVEIFCDLLQLPPEVGRWLGAESHFFELGGHSLLATRLVSRLRRYAGVELPLRAVFENPRLSDLARRVDEERNHGGRPTLPPITPRSAEDDPLPLSFAQQRLWFLAQLEGASASYNMPCALRLEGALNAPALEGSLLEIIHRHSALRTRFPAQDGEPRQVVEAPPAGILSTVDLSALEVPRRLREGDRLLAVQARRPFDLNLGPLVRALLIRHSGRLHQFLVDLHHIVSDGWSNGVLVRELSVLYSARCAHRSSSLPPLPVQYADFAVWQQRFLSATALAPQLAYWRQALAAAPPQLELPTDRPRPAVMSNRGAYGKALRIDAHTTDALRALEIQTGSTRFMSLFTACVVLLARASGQRDVVVGTPIANRGRAEIEPLIGFFANTLALRVRLAGRPTGHQLLHQVKTAALGGYDHQDLPFEHLVEALQPARDLSHTPLFQHLFLVDEASVATLRLPGLTFAPITVPTATAKFDLIVALHPIGEELVVGLEYNTDLFDPTTILRLTRAYRQLLQGLVADPERPVDEIPWLERAGRHQLLQEWGSSLAPPAPPVTEMVTERAQICPDSVALVAGDQTMSYRALVEEAGALATLLQHRGLAADCPVGLVAERQLETLVALLAILEAQASCLALDPTWPQKRLDFVLRDAGVRMVLGKRSSLDAMPLDGIETIVLEFPNPLLNPSPGLVGPRRRTFDDQLAYLVYTSGSTGQPKGVAMPHAALSSLVAWQNQNDPCTTGRTTQFSSLGFDVAFQEIFSTWAAGGTLVVAEEALRRDPPAFLHWLNRHRIERQFLPFVALQQLAEATEAGRPFPGSLERILTAGEQLQTTEALIAFFDHSKAPILSNQYGPSETHISNQHLLPPGPKSWPSLPPIGRPAAGRHALVLNPLLAPTALGVAGQIYLAGEGLARGYLHRPALTAERFIPHPFSSDAGQRLYQTGDLGRWLAGGELEFLGRLDQQVKIRGFRVEPGEIEVTLSQHPAVAECAVVTFQDLQGTLQLVACYRPSLSTDAAPGELRRHVQELLPAPMVPALFLAMEELPWTATGKVDRLTLTQQVTRREQEARASQPCHEQKTEREPKTEREVEELQTSQQAAPHDPTAQEIGHQLAEIWCRLLGLERVRRDANFFELGGHSLLIVKVQSEIRKHLGFEVPVVDLFRFPTLATLAHHLHPSLSATEAPPTPGLAAVPSNGGDGPLPVAIIGMAGRFPGAATVEDFWHNIRDGVESIRFFSDRELEEAGIAPALLQQPNYVKAKGVLDDIEGFDAHFFNISPSEAEIMDPQQRLFLECSWQALEGTGYLSPSYAGRVGVFAGSGFNSYFMHNLYPSRDRLGETNGLQVLIGAEKDFLPTTVSYRLNLRGPSIAVQTACSTSLVAVHLACRALASGDCELALAGGVGIHVPAAQGYLYEEGMIYSPDGHCRPFSGDAAGTVGGDGVAAVVLKPLAQAQADGDTIYAVVRGSALNNDGDLKVGFTAPGVDGQSEVIRNALKAAAVAAETIGYVEAHGSGTQLGDPVEVAALVNAFASDARGTCALGAVKANVGHLDAAAGVAALIKTTMALYHRELPAGLHSAKPHPQIDLEATPFYLNRERRPWPQGATPRRAGVSSFGIGGTNAHLILEEPPAPSRSTSSAPGGPFPLLLAARTAKALERRATDLRTWLQDHPEAPLADVAYTLAVGRRPFEHRWAMVCQDWAEALAALADLNSHELPTAAVQTSDEDRTSKLAAAARRWLAAEEVDWQAFFPAEEGRRFLPLPTYPFEHQRHWIDPPSTHEPPTARPTAEESTTSAPRLAGSHWWILENGTDLGAALADRLRMGGAQVVRAAPSVAFRDLGDQRYEVAPQTSSFVRLAAATARPHHVLHLWSLPRSATSEALPDLGFEGLQALGDALRLDAAVDPGTETTSAPEGHPVHLTAVLAPTNGGRLERDKAALLGMLTWLGGKREDLRCHVLEIEPPDQEQPQEGWLDRLFHLLAGGSEEPPSSATAKSQSNGAGKKLLANRAGKPFKRKARTVHPRPNLPVPLIAPESAEEQTLAELWRDLLRVEPIGIHDSFFELGGHSLVATQMLIRLRERFDVSLDLRMLFENPTISKLSEMVQNELWTRASLKEASLGMESAAAADVDEEEGEL